MFFSFKIFSTSMIKKVNFEISKISDRDDPESIRSTALSDENGACWVELTTTVLQLAALASGQGHKVCQRRTAVGQPIFTHQHPLQT